MLPIIEWANRKSSRITAGLTTCDKNASLAGTIRLPGVDIVNLTRLIRVAPHDKGSRDYIPEGLALEFEPERGSEEKVESDGELVTNDSSATVTDVTSDESDVECGVEYEVECEVESLVWLSLADNRSDERTESDKNVKKTRQSK